MLQLIDNYAATYSLLLISLFECIAISYVYGKFKICFTYICVEINIAVMMIMSQLPCATICKMSIC